MIPATPPEVVPTLIAALTDKHEWVRSNAARALTDIGPIDKDSIRALASALKNADEEVQLSIAGELGLLPADSDARSALTDYRRCLEKLRLRRIQRISRMTQEWLLPRSFGFAPDGKTLAVISMGRRAALWDAATGQQIADYVRHDRASTTAAFSADCKTLAWGCDNGDIFLWDTATSKELKTIKAHLDEVWAVAFTQDGQTLASGCYDGTLKLWDVATGKPRASLERHQFPIWSLRVAPDSRTLVSIACHERVPSELFEPTRSGEIKLWDITTGKALATVRVASCYAMASTSNSNLLAVSYWAPPFQVLILRDSRTGKEITVKTDAFGPLALTADGKIVASGAIYAAGRIKLFNATTGQLLDTVDTGSGQPWSLAFTPDGTVLASGHGNLNRAGEGDVTVNLWRAATGQNLKCLTVKTSLPQWQNGFLNPDTRPPNSASGT
jgi:WD40 repeat protein